MLYSREPRLAGLGVITRKTQELNERECAKERKVN